MARAQDLIQGRVPRPDPGGPDDPVDEFERELDEGLAGAVGGQRQPSPSPEEGDGGSFPGSNLLIDLLRQLDAGIEAAQGRQEESQGRGGSSLPPNIVAQIEAMDGFKESGATVEQLASLLTPSQFPGEPPTFDRAASQAISREIRTRIESVRKGEEATRKGEERETKAAQDAADREDAAAQQDLVNERADARIERQDVPKNIEQLMVKALLEDDFEQARRLQDFKNNPSNAEKLRLAIDFATSPADVFTLSAIADGVFPGQFDRKDGITSLPKSPFAQDLFDSVFGINQPPPAANQPPAQAPAPPPPVSSFQTPSPGGVGLQPQPAPSADTTPLFGGPEPFTRPGQIPTIQPEPLPPRQSSFTGLDEEDPFDRLGTPEEEAALFARSQQGTSPTQATSPFGGSEVARPFGGNELDQFAGLRLPAATPFDRPGQIPELDPLPPPPEFQPQGLPEQRLRPSERGVIPEGVPTFTTKFDGQDRRLPVRFGTLFRGIKDPSQQLQRPKSFLGAVGLPRLNPGTFSRLSAGEQDAFIRLGQESGLDPRDISREIEQGRPAQPRFKRITSAAGRSR